MTVQLEPLSATEREAQAVLDRVGAETEAPRRAEEPDAAERQRGIGRAWSAARMALTAFAIAGLVALIIFALR